MVGQNGSSVKIASAKTHLTGVDDKERMFHDVLTWLVKVELQSVQVK
jgi:hypothetical protein